MNLHLVIIRVSKGKKVKNEIMYEGESIWFTTIDRVHDIVAMACSLKELT